MNQSWVRPVTLAGWGVRLVPLELAHAVGLAEAAADGELWTLRVTSVPEPGQEAAYIAEALATPDRVPFAVLDENDFPAVLAHAESLTAEKGEEFGAAVPLINQKAIDYFIEHKYKVDTFSALFMSNVPFGKFENYLCFAPEFFL